ncbi:hypothetical protein [Delftia acidovorans]|uniref:hypothetical protein n=1 Tax=Delftia acidovorans TaxID=80866 RepID=UPI0022AB7243|nr:hypothetical protein [Delftia acidovorans]WAT83537.1 hypothetical protein O1V13_19030 [Delftia acidovorans]
MRTFLILACLAGLVTALVWAVLKPGYDSVLAAIVALASLLGVLSSKNNEPKHTMSQKIGDGGIGIQAGRDVKIRDFKGE